MIRKGVKAQIINSRLLNMQTQQLIEEFGLSISPKATARKLSAVERCSVEIMKAVALGARIVILLDLSSFLSDSEVEQLFHLIERMRHKELGFLMVDSSVRHLSNHADRVVVIKKGRNFWTFGCGEVDEQVMKSCLYCEQQSSEADASSETRTERSRVLVFEQVRSGTLAGLSFTLHQGEELCIFDQEGAGIEEIKALLSGDHPADAGRILVEGESSCFACSKAYCAQWAS